MMAKEMLPKRKNNNSPGQAKVRKTRRKGYGNPEDVVKAPPDLLTGLSNREVQRILEGGGRVADSGPVVALADYLRRGSDTGSSLSIAGLAPQVLRQMAEEAQAEQVAKTPKAVKGTVTIRPVHVDYYNVTGNTLEEVAGQLDPEEWGHCDAHYNYSYSATNGRTTRVNVILTLNIRLPRWRGRGWRRASAQAKGEWNRMLEALRKHEDRHAEIARKWAPIFQERLFDKDEGDLEQESTAVEGDAQKEQDQFDVDTAHGQNQGVSLDTSI